MSDTNMTEAEVKLEDEKLRAEISKLIAETSKLGNESKHLWIQSIVAPFVAAAAVIGATAAIVKIFF
jgi:hypothetical protein